MEEDIRSRYGEISEIKNLNSINTYYMLTLE
jgi:hypothetical protein